MLPNSEIKKADIKDYIQIIKKRLWILVIFAVVGAFVAVFQAINAEKAYRTSTTILLEEQRPIFGNSLKDVGYKQQVKRDSDTQMKLLKSRTLAEKVSDKLNGRYSPYGLLRMVDISSNREAKNLVTISVTGRKPADVAKIANTWVQAFLEQDVASRKELEQTGAQWLEENLKNTYQKMQESERKLYEFTQKNPEAVAKAGIIEKLEKSREDIEGEIRKLSLQYTDSHYRIVSLKQSLEKIKEQINEEKEGMEDIQDKVLTYEVLKKQVQHYKDIHDDLIMASKQLEVSSKLIFPSAKVIDPARVPGTPLPQNLMHMQTFILSLIIGLGLCFLAEYLDTTLSDPEEVEFYVGLPYLGEVPEAKKADMVPRPDNPELKDKKMIVNFRPDSPEAEAFRNIKVSLVFVTPEGKPMQSLLVSSAGVEEGKTFTASNLAIAFAQGDESTLLIDSDLRHGELKEAFGLEKEEGLSSYLSGKASLEEAIASSNIKNLDILPSGPHVVNSQDLLEPGKLKELIEKVRTKYKRIIVDTSSLSRFYDVLPWESSCDSYFLVVKANKTKLEDVNQALKKLSKLPGLGAVLNFHRPLPQSRIKRIIRKVQDALNKLWPGK
ncbi:MAG: polysaccharide biosynthesis tyrosine autokinase [Candidatus Omnitrophica bacterium]|nr:polysaccharide biosynthesis tyrosine autokinase [Candidatus Omnitrophota bacterium]